MGRARLAVVLLVACLGVALLPGATLAFHEGGAGYCEGCHELHPAQNPGQPRSTAPYMLKGSDASSTCLRCHGEPGNAYAVLSGDGSARTPGGDFYWLGRTFSWSAEGRARQSAGSQHGHNVVAADRGLQADPQHLRAPGGTFPSSSLGCTSCHDPHGKSAGRQVVSGSGSYGQTAVAGTTLGSYRMLGGVGYAGFARPAPVAVAPGGSLAESDTSHPAYGSGMSEWCANCHQDFANASRKHPSGSTARLGPAMIAAYNAYVKSGDSSGAAARAYLALVPFEQGVTDVALLKPSSTAGPETAANVMCLSCHRAHASAFSSIGRWDFAATFLADSHPRQGDGGASLTDVQNSYYGQDVVARFGRYQRSLCNKCHVLD